MAGGIIEQELHAAAADLAAARGAFRQAIIRARAAGLSLRDISTAAGVSHETVRRIAGEAE